MLISKSTKAARFNTRKHLTHPKGEKASCSNNNIRNLHEAKKPHLLDEHKLLHLLHKLDSSKTPDFYELKKFIYSILRASLTGLSSTISASNKDKNILERFSQTINQISAIAMRNLHNLYKQNEVLRILDAFYIDEVLHDNQKFPIREETRKQLDDSEQKFALLTSRARNPVYLNLDLRPDSFDFGSNFEFLPKLQIKTASNRSLQAVADMFSVVPIAKKVLELPTVYCVADYLDSAAVTFPNSDLIFICGEHLAETEEIFGKAFSIEEYIAHEKTHLILHNLGFGPTEEENLQSIENDSQHEFIANAVEMQVAPLHTFFCLIWTVLPDSYALVSKQLKIFADDFLHKNMGLRLSDVMGRDFVPSDKKTRAEIFSDFINAFTKAIGEEGLRDLMKYVTDQLKISAQRMLIDLYKQKRLNTDLLERLAKEQGTSAVAG